MSLISRKQSQFDDVRDVLNATDSVLGLIEDLTANQREDQVMCNTAGLFWIVSLLRDEIRPHLQDKP